MFSFPLKVLAFFNLNRPHFKPGIETQIILILNHNALLLIFFCLMKLTCSPTEKINYSLKFYLCL